MRSNKVGMLNRALGGRLGGAISRVIETVSGMTGTRQLGYVLATSLLTFLIWAAVAPLDMVSDATGEVIPASQVKMVQHLEGGVVSEIHVKEGERVQRDQPIATLEAAAPSADVGEIHAHIDGLRLEVARLRAESSGQGFAAPTGVSSQMAREAQALYSSRRANLQANLRTQQEIIAQREHAIREIVARISNTQNALKIIREQLHISEKLLKEEITSKMEHLALQREESGLKSRLEEDQAMIKRLEASIAESRAQLTGIREGYHQQVNSDLARSSREMSEMEQRVGKHVDAQRRSVLRAPTDGVVKILHVTTRGGVIQPGQTVAEVVPSGDMLVIEAQLPVQEIGYVRKGQRASVRLASADAGRFGTLEGEVVLVSPDSIVTEEGAFYKVRVETKADRFSQGGSEYRLVPGVSVNVAIVTGRRTVLSYLLDPFIAGSGRVFQEH